MSSISVGELKTALNHYPDDYEVLMGITKYDRETEGHKKWSIAFINAVGPKDDSEDYREIYLMN